MFSHGLKYYYEKTVGAVIISRDLGNAKYGEPLKYEIIEIWKFDTTGALYSLSKLYIVL